MTIKTLLYMGLVLSSVASAQDADGRIQVNTRSGVDRDIPAVAGDEGPMRYPARVPADADSFLPDEPPAFGGVHFGPNEAVIYDVSTGVETYHALPTDGLAPSGYVSGRALFEQVSEPGLDSLGALSSISSTSYPWSTHCRLFYTKGGIRRIASGTLIDAQHLIAAGHSVHLGNGSGKSGWSSNFTITPSWDGDDDAYGSAGATRLMSFSGWTKSGSYSHDMGFIRLDRPVGFLTGWLGYFYNNSNSWWRSTTFHATGYPGGTCFSGAPNQLYYHYGAWDTVRKYRVHTNKSESCWVGGMSGGGAYYKNNSGSRYVGANTSTGTKSSSGGTKRMGYCRMTSNKFSSAGNFINNGYSTTQVDWVPLKTQLGQSSIPAGSRLSSMKFVLANRSRFNPSRRTIPIDVYLSTNDNISTFDKLIQSTSVTWDFGPKDEVTVNFGTPPRISSSTSPGGYWVGVIIDEIDANGANNDTDGWDAAPLRVY